MGSFPVAACRRFRVVRLDQYSAAQPHTFGITTLGARTRDLISEFRVVLGPMMASIGLIGPSTGPPPIGPLIGSVKFPTSPTGSCPDTTLPTPYSLLPTTDPPPHTGQGSEWLIPHEKQAIDALATTGN